MVQLDQSMHILGNVLFLIFGKRLKPLGERYQVENVTDGRQYGCV